MISSINYPQQLLFIAGKKILCSLSCIAFLFNPKFILFYSQFEGELYLLATDQGYINQPDLVWEKLNEVKHDTLVSRLF